MDPSTYVPAYLEALYAQSHPDLTEGGLAMVRSEIARDPEPYATTDHARALLSYARLHAELARAIDRMEDLPDDDFERTRERVFDKARRDLHLLFRADERCIDAELVAILLTDAPTDRRLHDLLLLEQQAREQLEQGDPEFDAEEPGYWRPGAPTARDPQTVRAKPAFIGWLHTLEALSQECIASARYRAAARYAQSVMRAPSYPNLAIGTLLLAYARLEDEDAFFAAAREAGDEAEGLPWFLLGRTLLLYKLGRERSARRALRDFANRCDGGAFFLLNPTYLPPYIPTRPAVRESWELSHQAVWEADGIIVDTPDFAAWAASVDGTEANSEAFAARNGF